LHPDAIRKDQDVPEPHRSILSHASLFEGPFNVDWLQEISGAKTSQVFAAIEFGVQKKWLAGREGCFHFLSDLERNRLRKSFLPDEMRLLQKQIVNILRNESSDDPGAIKNITTYLLNLTNDLEGCRLLIEQGNLNRKASLHKEAGRFYEKALEDLGKIHDKEADRLFVDAVLQYLKVYTDDPVSDQIRSFIREAMDRALERGYRSSLALLEMNMARSEWLQASYHKAAKHFEKGWALAEKSEDSETQKAAMVFKLHFHYFMGHYQEAIKIYEMIVPDVENFPKNNFPLLTALIAGTCYVYTGQVTQGLGMLDALRLHSRKKGNLYIASHAGVTLGHLFLELQRLDEAKQCLETGLKESQTSRNLYARLSGLASLSLVFKQLNDIKKATSLLREFMDLCKRSRMPMRHSSFLMDVCWDMEQGILPKIEEFSLEHEIQAAIKGGNVFTKGIAYRYEALLLGPRDKTERDAVSDLKRSIRFLEQSGHELELAKSKLELARVYYRLGEKSRAESTAEPAVNTLHSYSEALVPDDMISMIKDFRSADNLLHEILRLGQELVTIRDNRDLLRRIISTGNRITGAERGAIFLVSEEQANNLYLRAAKNLTSEDIQASEFKHSMELIEEACRTGRGRIADFGGREDLLPESSRIRSCIFVPMTMHGKVVGILYHDNRLLRSAFSESDLKILNYFASQAAIALDNAQAWETLQGLYEKQQIEKQYYKEQCLKNEGFENFVGQSPGIANVFSQIEEVAGTDATVLITGETGVGKELVAWSIHSNSKRQNNPFIRVNCGALSESLICSELFGHEKGAFTGAASRRIGRFELADGGTLFLDEISEISMEVQVRLLRVLQTKEFERLGGQKVHRSDFRLLVATNRDLRKEVKAGRFREDLYYRINVFPIHVPPLRERKEDIPILANHFLRIYAAKFNKAVDRIAVPEMEKLAAYSWPGNVRELENVIERGVILSKGPYYCIPALKQTLSDQNAASDSTSLQENERNHILSILAMTRGKINGPKGAAEILKIHPNTLRSRMKKLGIQTRNNNYIS
jgi:transcriptional regulator with GAF, ATPase, and Fis domain